MATSLREARWLLALLPARCCLCGLPADTTRDLCTRCAADLPVPEEPCPRCGEAVAAGAGLWPCGRCQRAPPPWAALAARCRWGSGVDALVHGLKFGGHPECARVMASLMVERPPAFLAPETILLPVPLHWRRRWQRGFDQAALLAGHLGRATGLPCLGDRLRRRRATTPQSGQPAGRRRRALRGAFHATGRAMPERVCLVDDVVTTGATVAAAARACRRAGAREVTVWAFARTDRDGRRHGGGLRRR